MRALQPPLGFTIGFGWEGGLVVLSVCCRQTDSLGSQLCDAECVSQLSAVPTPVRWGPKLLEKACLELILPSSQDFKFQASLGCITSPCLKKKNTHESQNIVWEMKPRKEACEKHLQLCFFLPQWTPSTTAGPYLSNSLVPQALSHPENLSTVGCWSAK